MARDQITLVFMTDLNNSNAEDKHSTSPQDDAAAHAHANDHTEDNDIADLDAAWSSFEESHADELDEVARSRSAKRFEKHAERQAKEALISVSDLDEGSFTGDKPARGPRDFTTSSWLDVNHTMDQYGDDFVPPNPKIGHVATSRLVFWAFLIIGVIGVIITVFLPTIAGLLGTVFGVAIFIGAAGLILQHRGYDETKSDAFDDGARV